MKNRRVWLAACVVWGTLPVVSGVSAWGQEAARSGPFRSALVSSESKSSVQPAAFWSRLFFPGSAAEEGRAAVQPAPGSEQKCGPAGGECAGGGCPGEECPDPFWAHRTGLFGEFIYWSPRELDLRYATRVDGTVSSAVPLARPATADPTYQPGFRVGGSLALDCEQSIVVAYTYYRSDTTDSISATGDGQWIRPDTVHPNTLTVASDRLLAVANYDTRFQMADLGYKHLLWCTDTSAVNYVFGVRYAELDHDFTGNYTNEDVITVTTDINFTGIGPRFGLDAERLFGAHLFGYGKLFGTLLMGEFRSDYLQQQNTIITQATTGFVDDRVVPQLELEFGIGWQSTCGRVRVSAGYYVGAWFNTVTTAELIEGAQADNFNHVSDTIVFDGLTARAELRF